VGVHGRQAVLQEAGDLPTNLGEPMQRSSETQHGEPQGYAGEYRSGGADAVSGLVLLEDGTFCFSFMGGTLDHVAAGRWCELPDGSGIQLREVRPDTPAFIVRLIDAPVERICFVFSGYSLS
jgi:hypothetical protein